MAFGEPGKTNAPFTFCNHGNLGHVISIEIDHAAGTVDIKFRPPVELTMTNHTRRHAMRCGSGRTPLAELNGA